MRAVFARPGTQRSRPGLAQNSAAANDASTNTGSTGDVASSWAKAAVSVGQPSLGGPSRGRAGWCRGQGGRVVSLACTFAEVAVDHVGVTATEGYDVKTLDHA